MLSSYVIQLGLRLSRFCQFQSWQLYRFIVIQSVCGQYLIIRNIENEYSVTAYPLEIAYNQKSNAKNSAIEVLTSKCTHLYLHAQKKIKLLRKQNQQLRTIEDKQTQQDTAILLNSKELSDANSKLQNVIEEMESKLNQPLRGQEGEEMGMGGDVPSVSTVVIGTTTINDETEEVDLANSGLKYEDILPIRGFQNLKTLIVGENLLSDDAVSMICTRLINLRKLYLNHNPFSSSALNSLSSLSSLKHLDIRNNKLGDQCLAFISPLAASITQISLSQNKLTDKCCPHLAKLSNLTYLDITNNEITDQGVKSIIKLDKLTHLYISCNKLTALSIRWIIKDLKDLIVFDVRFNRVGEDERERVKAGKPETMQMFV